MATIKEDYVSFETAKLLKEKGFDQNCATYYLDGQVWCHYHSEVIPKGKQIYAAPTQAMAMKWLREVHNIHIAALCPIIDIDTDVFGVKYNVVISNLKNYCLAFNTDIEDNEYNTYEEACEAAIKDCLEHLI